LELNWGEAFQGKVWIEDPGGNAGEVFVVNGESPVMAKERRVLPPSGWIGRQGDGWLLRLTSGGGR
jgi:hypothetical protein